MKAFVDIYSSAVWYKFIVREEESSDADILHSVFWECREET
jgi:hypothetical protein